MLCGRRKQVTECVTLAIQLGRTLWYTFLALSWRGLLQEPHHSGIGAQVRLALEVMFEGTKGDTDLGQVTPGAMQEPGASQSLRVGDAVSVSYKAEEGGEPAHVVLEWEGGSTSDMVADAVIAIILQVHCGI